MSDFFTLPSIMVAPNGARLSKADHPGLPVTIAELVDEGKACFQAGAGAMHAHVRDHEGRHVLDADLYQELAQELKTQVPELVLQITTEAHSRFTVSQQIALVKRLRPKTASVALRELTGFQAGAKEAPRAGAQSRAQAGTQSRAQAGTYGDFYHFAGAAGIAIQHILYDAKELAYLRALLEAGRVPPENLQMLFVLGTYGVKEAVPEDLAPFLLELEHFKRLGHTLDWALCAFGARESDCLLSGAKQGGKVRVGFENNTRNGDGTIAKNNAERVAEIAKILGEQPA